MLDVDIATMLYHRMRTPIETNRYYMWADSSPQGGVDWLVTRYDTIPISISGASLRFLLILALLTEQASGNGKYPGTVGRRGR